jgi:hypothetical protein
VGLSRRFSAAESSRRTRSRRSTKLAMPGALVVVAILLAALKAVPVAQILPSVAPAVHFLLDLQEAVPVLVAAAADSRKVKEESATAPPAGMCTASMRLGLRARTRTRPLLVVALAGLRIDRRVGMSRRRIHILVGSRDLAAEEKSLHRKVPGPCILPALPNLIVVDREQGHRGQPPQTQVHVTLADQRLQHLQHLRREYMYLSGTNRPPPVLAIEALAHTNCPCPRPSRQRQPLPRRILGELGGRRPNLRHFGRKSKIRR